MANLRPLVVIAQMKKPNDFDAPEIHAYGIAWVPAGWRDPHGRLHYGEPCEKLFYVSNHGGERAALAAAMIALERNAF